tara:strand:- start:223 stop:543 length:321 start_codon:yes stop_codon:yes gene_type:complete
MSDTERPKQTNKPKQSERPKQVEEPKIPTKPCWYMLNNFKCCNENCTFSHDVKMINEHKQKREKELCKEFKKCQGKCNKYHNVFEIMDLYKDISNKLEIIKGVVKH